MSGGAPSSAMGLKINTETFHQLGLFSIAIGMEVVIPLESKFPTLQTKHFVLKTTADAIE